MNKKPKFGEGSKICSQNFFGLNNNSRRQLYFKNDSGISYFLFR